MQPASQAKVPFIAVLSRPSQGPCSPHIACVTHASGGSLSFWLFRKAHAQRADRTRITCLPSTIYTLQLFVPYTHASHLRCVETPLRVSSLGNCCFQVLPLKPHTETSKMLRNEHSFELLQAPLRFAPDQPKPARQKNDAAPKVSKPLRFWAPRTWCP